MDYPVWAPMMSLAPGNRDLAVPVAGQDRVRRDLYQAVRTEYSRCRHGFAISLFRQGGERPGRAGGRRRGVAAVCLGMAGVQGVK